MTVHWYDRPSGQKVALRATPRLASWNKATDRDQIALREYLLDTVELATSSIPPIGPWSLRLDVGLPENRALTADADLDNYALPLATALPSKQLVTVWCSKRHAASSHLVIGPAHLKNPPSGAVQIRTTASASTPAYKHQVRNAVADMAELADGPVRLQIAFAVGPTRNWMNLWKPTIDALDPLLGRTHPAREWHPRDGRIVDLGLHRTIDPNLGYEVEVALVAEEACRVR